MIFYKIKNLKKGLKFILLFLSIIFLMFGLISCSGTINDVEQYSQESTESIVEDDADLEQIENNFENIINIASMGFNDSFYVSENKVHDFSYDGNKASIQTFDILSGKKLWEWQDEWEKSGKILGADSELLYITREDYRIYAFNINDGELEWKIILEDSKNIKIISNSKNEKIVYFILSDINGNFEISAVSKQDGSILWLIPDIGARRVLTSDTGKTLLVETGSLYNSGFYIGIDPESGITKYETKLIGLYNGDIIPDNTFLALGSIHPSGFVGEITVGSIVLFKIDSGEIVWITENDDIFDIIDVSSNCVYAIIEEDPAYLIVFDLKTGEELWYCEDISCGLNMYGDRKLLGEFGDVTIISNANKSITWGVDSKNGNIIWENDDLVLTEVLGITNNIIVSLNPKNFIYGIDIKTGEKKWKLDISEEKIIKILSNESERNISGIVENNKIICFNEEGLIIIDPSNGNKIANITIPNIDQSSSFYLKENLLIIKSNSSVSIIKV